MKRSCQMKHPIPGICIFSRNIEIISLVFGVLLSLAISPLKCSSSNFNISVLGELEILADAYYNGQKNERTVAMSVDLNKINPNFPCLFGTIPIGGTDQTGIKDGHKFACGLHAISGPPIVYSFGSNRDQRFELALLRLRPDALVYIFELDPTQLPEYRDPRIQYFTTGLGGYPDDNILKSKTNRKLVNMFEFLHGKDSNPTLKSKLVPNDRDPKESVTESRSTNFKFKTMYDIMVDLNHTYVDILKMDIEGYEFKWLKFEANIVVKRIGQFLVEVHVDNKLNDALQFTKQLEEFDMRVFHKELNHLWEYGSEFSFIQKQWTVWESQKSLLLPLTAVPEGVLFDQIVKFQHESSDLVSHIPHKYFLSCGKVLHHLPDKATLGYVTERLENLNIGIAVNTIDVPTKSSLDEFATSKGHTFGIPFLSMSNVLDQAKGTVMMQPKYTPDVYIMTPSGKRARIPSQELFYQLGGTITVVLHEVPLCEAALIPLCRDDFNECMK